MNILTDTHKRLPAIPLSLMHPLAESMTEIDNGMRAAGEIMAGSVKHQFLSLRFNQ